MKQKDYVFDASYQPQVRAKRDTRAIMLDVLIALVPAMGVAIWAFGLSALIVILSSVLSCLFFEWGYRKIMKKTSTIGDLSACVTGVLLALTMPAAAHWWMMIIGAFFSIVVVKQLYGGLGKNFVNPALAGRAFLLASYSTVLTTWNVPSMLQGAVDGVTMSTPLYYLYSGAAMPDYYSFGNLLLGMRAGSLGELSAIALLLGLAYLLIRKVISWRIPVGFIGTVAILSLIFGHEGYGNVEWMVYNVLSGGLILGACFMATDFATSPVTPVGQLIYAFGCGAITVLIRYFGGFAEGVTYAILIMNLLAFALDKNTKVRQFGVTKEDVQAAKQAKKAAKKAAKEAQA